MPLTGEKIPDLLALPSVILIFLNGFPLQFSVWRVISPAHTHPWPSPQALISALSPPVL